MTNSDVLGVICYMRYLCSLQPGVFMGLNIKLKQTKSANTQHLNLGKIDTLDLGKITL